MSHAIYLWCSFLPCNFFPKLTLSFMCYRELLDSQKLFYFEGQSDSKI